MIKILSGINISHKKLSRAILAFTGNFGYRNFVCPTKNVFLEIENTIGRGAWERMSEVHRKKENT